MLCTSTCTVYCGEICVLLCGEMIIAAERVGTLFPGFQDGSPFIFRVFESSIGFGGHKSNRRYEKLEWIWSEWDEMSMGSGVLVVCTPWDGEKMHCWVSTAEYKYHTERPLSGVWVEKKSYFLVKNTCFPPIFTQNLCETYIVQTLQSLCVWEKKFLRD